MQYGTLLDYIRWRGDISFLQDGFNVVDNLVFSFVAYSDFHDVPITKEENESGITLKEYYERLMKNGGFPKSLSWIIKEEELSLIANSPRFSGVIVKNFVYVIESEKDSVQFCAMNFCFGRNEHYLAFQGTDNSIAGWREDADLTYKRVPAQDMAVRYIEENIDDGIYYIGGHSKGANLAIYGAAMISDEKRKYVKQVYDNDGPGICKDVMDPSFLAGIDDITTRIIPTYSVIGMFFPYSFTHSYIVHSNEKTLMQHDIKSWLVLGSSLYLAEKIDDEAKKIDDALDTFISNTKLEERENTLNDLFRTFDDAGKKKTVTSVTDGGLKELNRILLQLSDTSTGTKKTLNKIPLTVLFGRTLMKLRHKKPLEFLIDYPSIPMGVLFMALGFFFLFVKETYIPYIVGTAFVLVTLTEFVTFFYLFYLSHWNLKQNLVRLYIIVISISISCAYFISGELMNSFSSVVLGIVLMVLSFIMITRAMELYKRKDILLMVICIIEVLMMFATGLYFVIIHSFESDKLLRLAGIIFLCLSGLRIFDGIYELIKNHSMKRS
jgi:hypothetical protein